MNAALGGAQVPLPKLPPPKLPPPKLPPRGPAAGGAPASAATSARELAEGVWSRFRSLPPPVRWLASSAALIGVALAVVGIGRALGPGGGSDEQAGPATTSSAAAEREGERMGETLDLDALEGTSTAPSLGPTASAGAVPPAAARVPLEEARKALARRANAEAVSAVERALDLDPSLVGDELVAEVLRRGAQAPESAGAAFALLTSKMRDRGAELLWDLAEAADTKPAARRRAGQWLRSPDFRRAASPSLVLAADLRTAKTCAHAHELLPAAREIGDERSLAQLEAWTRRTGCGADRQEDCMPCLRKDDRLDDALLAIRQRGKGAADARARASGGAGRPAMNGPP